VLTDYSCCFLLRAARLLESAVVINWSDRDGMREGMWWAACSLVTVSESRLLLSCKRGMRTTWTSPLNIGPETLTKRIGERAFGT
jgi:hypothetical protein